MATVTVSEMESRLTIWTLNAESIEHIIIIIIIIYIQPSFTTLFIYKSIVNLCSFFLDWVIDTNSV